MTHFHTLGRGYDTDVDVILLRRKGKKGGKEGNQYYFLHVKMRISCYDDERNGAAHLETEMQKYKKIL